MTQQSLVPQALQYPFGKPLTRFAVSSCVALWDSLLDSAASQLMIRSFCVTQTFIGALKPALAIAHNVTIGV